MGARPQLSLAPYTIRERRHHIAVYARTRWVGDIWPTGLDSRTRTYIARPATSRPSTYSPPFSELAQAVEWLLNADPLFPKEVSSHV